MSVLAPELIGNEPARRYLRLLVTRSSAKGSYLFVGPEGVGKRTTALAFAKALQCLNQPNKAPCGTCASCREWTKNTHPDVLIVERPPDRTAILLQQIRPTENGDVAPEDTIQHRLQLHPLLGRHQVVVIDNAESLHPSAANALLKTLEEPSASTVIILIATNTDSLLKTVVSRCSLIQFTRVATAEIRAALKNTGSIDSKVQETIIALADGSPGKAFQLIARPELLQLASDQVELLISLLRNCRQDPFGLTNAFFAKTTTTTRDTATNLIHLLQLILNDCILADLGLSHLYHFPRFRSAIESLTMSLGPRGGYNAAVGTLRLTERINANVPAKAAFDSFTNRLATYV